MLTRHMDHRILSPERWAWTIVYTSDPLRRYALTGGSVLTAVSLSRLRSISVLRRQRIHDLRLRPADVHE